MDDTVSGLWKRLEKLEAERDELQHKLNIAVKAMQKAHREVASTTGVYSRIRAVDIIEEALKKLEEL